MHGVLSRPCRSPSRLSVRLGGRFGSVPRVRASPAAALLFGPAAAAHFRGGQLGLERRDSPRSAVKTAAVAVEAPPALEHSKTFRYGKGVFELHVNVAEKESGDQHVHLETNHPSTNLILHWGVQGGKNYRGGWRLPQQRPPETVQYKERALQTSWQRGAGDKQVLDIELTGDEASDYLNFVLKDAATNTWYDSNGANFQLALRTSLRSFASIDDAEISGEIFSLEEIPEIPGELAGVWAYVMWEAAGCPGRSQEAADAEYAAGIRELQTCLCRGKTLDELWSVARGEVPYLKFKEDFIERGGRAGTKAGPPVAVVEPPTRTLDSMSSIDVEEVTIPDDLIGVQAYLLWEKAGQPDGADFTEKARALLTERLRAGESLTEIEEAIRGPKKDRGAKGSASAAAPLAPAEVGQAIEVPRPDPLKLIKQTEVPVLSSAKKDAPNRPLEFLVQAAAVDDATRFRRAFRVADGSEVLAVVRQTRGDADGGAESDIEVTLTTDEPNKVILHWGVATASERSWQPPPEAIWPERSEATKGGGAVETPFRGADDPDTPRALLESRVPLQQLSITVPRDSDITSLQFVLRSADGSAWYRDGASNFAVTLARRDAATGGAAAPADAFVQSIIDAENSSAWTLMHRFNRAADLIGEVMSGAHDDVSRAYAALYVWLRLSATRHLTWQRNYNTQPRILSAAQARLTGAVASAHAATSGESQEWVRLMLSTVGRGGDGQAIRDEILNIMHRNHIPEKKGTWMEQWHQKLHNNTTPDDVPICEAYIAFLGANGDAGTFWRVLSDNGISRERLAGYDRPITVEPQDFPDKRGALIRDFTNYLAILKAVHSGADLENAARGAGDIPAAAKGHLGFVLASRGSNQVLPLIQGAVACRTELHSALPGNKNLLYLDLALEAVVRAAVERGVSSFGLGAAAFVGPLLQNLVLTAGDNEELCYCLKAWQALPRSIQYGSTPSNTEALQATAIIDRLRRAVGALSDATVARVQPLAESIGGGCGVETWAVSLFAEEVVRGGPAFAVSLVLSTVEPALRRCAELGAWQVISPASVIGRVVEIAALGDVQDSVYEEPTILVAQRVSGEEEIPEGAVAVLTPDAPDLLSHSSVRARNMKVLFATCHEQEPLDELRAARGSVLRIDTTAAGGVAWAPEDDSSLTGSNSDGNGSGDGARRTTPRFKMTIPKWCGRWAVGMGDYADGVVGAKSKNLAALRGALPDWVRLPASVTLPFGCFEAVLDARENREVKRELEAAARAVAKAPARNLAACREVVMRLRLPLNLQGELTSEMDAAGIPPPDSPERWQDAERALVGVWASKFNDRAFFSMRKVGLDFMDLRMAVLVQRVVPARYAFVIHTRNPSSGDENEVYCELVKGLGESLVSGTVPGSALSFAAAKDRLDEPTILTFPSKATGMFVRESLIFRSDSNGEDLAGYAGAGLYESITMDPTTLEIIDFSGDEIMADDGFRKALMSRICEVGVAIEQAMGSAQDIEGVVDPDGNITVVQTRPQV